MTTLTLLRQEQDTEVTEKEYYRYRVETVVPKKYLTSVVKHLSKGSRRSHFYVHELPTTLEELSSIEGLELTVAKQIIKNCRVRGIELKEGCWDDLAVAGRHKLNFIAEITKKCPKPLDSTNHILIEAEKTEQDTPEINKKQPMTTLTPLLETFDKEQAARKAKEQALRQAAIDYMATTEIIDLEANPSPYRCSILKPNDPEFWGGAPARGQAKVEQEQEQKGAQNNNEALPTTEAPRLKFNIEVLSARWETLLKEVQEIKASVLRPITNISQKLAGNKVPAQVEPAPSNNIVVIPPSKKKRNKNSKQYKGQGFLSTGGLPVTKGLYHCFLELLQPFNDDTKKFYCHLYSSSCANLKKKDDAASQDGWVEIPYKLIVSELPLCDTGALEAAGIIEIDHSYLAGSYCKHYRLAPGSAEIISDRLLSDLLEGEGEIYDLATGNVIKSPLQSRYRNSEDVRASDLQRAAIDSYKNSPNVFHQPSVLKVLTNKKKAYEEELKLNGRTELFEKLKRSFWNSLYSYKSVITDYVAFPLPTGGGFWAYVPAYEPQKSGRLSHLKGGFQTCSREMTAAAFANCRYLNYDLAASQPTIYNEMLKSYGIDDGGWLQNYIDGKITKQMVADQIGISVDSWKRILCGLLMGSLVPSMSLDSFKKAEHIKGNNISSIIKNLLEDHTPEQAYDSYTKFLTFCEPLLKAVTEVGNRIKLAVKNKDTNLLPELRQNQGKWSVLNKAGNHLPLEGLKPSDLVAKVAAHILQGAERALVSNILILAPKYGFRPVADYHDGFLSDGLVSQECVDEAIAACGVFGKLVEKPLESPLVDESEEFDPEIERLVYSSDARFITAAVTSPRRPSNRRQKSVPIQPPILRAHQVSQK